MVNYTIYHSNPIGLYLKGYPIVSYFSCRLLNTNRIIYSIGLNLKVIIPCVFVAVNDSFAPLGQPSRSVA